MGSHSERNRNRANHTIITVFIEHVLYARCYNEYLRCLIPLNPPNQPVRKALRQLLGGQGMALLSPLHMSRDVGRRFPWQCYRKGQNTVALDLDLQCALYAVLGVTDSGEVGE